MCYTYLFAISLTRWEEKVETYEAMLHFACGITVWNKTLLVLVINLQINHPLWR